MFKKLEDKVEDMMLTPEERESKELQRQAEGVTNSILASGFMVGLGNMLMAKTSAQYQENLIKLDNDFTLEMMKNNQVHEEISRIQDNADAVIGATLSSGVLADSDSLNRLLDYLDNTSAAVVAMRQDENRQKKKRRPKKTEKEIIAETDYEEVHQNGSGNTETE